MRFYFFYPTNHPETTSRAEAETMVVAVMPEGVAKAAQNLHSAIVVTEVATVVIVQDGEETKI